MRKRRLIFIALSLLLIGAHQLIFAGEKIEMTTKADSDILWICLAAFLVFFMQAGFAMVEAGMTRAKNASNIIMKNLMDFAVGSIIFWLIGAGIMFGVNESGFFGTIDFGLDKYLYTMTAVMKDGAAVMKDGKAVMKAVAVPLSFANLIFQTVFAATAATIVSGAMAERTKFHAYLIYSVVVTVIIYPVFGSWAWNSLWGATLADGKPSLGWLEKLGFIDFAGSTVVHSIGAWVGLAGTIVLGARRGKYVNGAVKPIPGHSMTLAGLGVFILWLGWFGFNPGSTTSVGGDMAIIAVTTNLAAAAGAIGALLTGWIFLKKPDVGITLNGALAGLVAITAGCANTTPTGAAIIGFTGGIIVVISVLVFDKLRIDDPVGALSVHGTAGAWGTLLVGVLDNTGKAGVKQLLVQFYGVAAAFVWAFGVGLILFYLLKFTVGLRVTEEEEAQGLDLSEHAAEAYADFRIAQR